MTVRRRELVLAASLALVFGAAPTVGDVGACGKTASDLDFAAFARARKEIDCGRCTECAIASDHCRRACDLAQPSDVAFPPSCHPLLHDGEVCVRALRSASCADYATYVDDVAPQVPTECDFCHANDDAAVSSPARPLEAH